MMAARRLVAAALVLATIIGVVVVQHARPVHSVPAEFSRLGTATMPFVPKGDFVTSAWFCAGVPIGKAQHGGIAIVANPGDLALTGKITDFTDAAGVAAVAAPFEVPARSTQRVRSGQDATAGIVRLVDGRDLRGRRIRRAARRQPVGKCSLAVLELDVVDVVLRRRLHGRGQQGTTDHHQPVPVRRDRQHQRGHEHRESEAGHLAEPARAGQLGPGHQPGPACQTGVGAGDHRHQPPAGGSSSVGHRNT